MYAAPGVGGNTRCLDGEAGYPEVNAENYVQLQRDLARQGEKGSDDQIEFLTADGGHRQLPGLPPGKRCLPL